MNKQEMLKELFGDPAVTYDSIMSEGKRIYEYQESIGNPYSMHVTFEFIQKEINKINPDQELTSSVPELRN